MSIITGTMPVHLNIQYMGTDISSEAMTDHICTTASALSRRVAFSMAVSPPVMAISATAGESSMKWSVWSPHEKARLLSSGPAAMHTSMPSSAATRLHALTILMKRSMPSVSP